MARWIELISTSEVTPGKCRTVQVDGKAYAVYNVDGAFFCTDDECIHQGGPLGEGTLEGNCVSCPWHGWEYDVKTGECMDMPGEKLNVHPTRVEGDRIQIEVA